jgi:hypothetical protein
MPVILATQEAEGRDQDDSGLKPAWENSSQDPVSKKKNHTQKKKNHKKRAGRVALSSGRYRP